MLRKNSILHAGPLMAKRGTSEVIHCHECGYAHLNPLPEHVDEYYSRDKFYASHSPPDWFEKEKREYEAGLWNPSFRYQSDLLDKSWSSPLLDWGTGAGWFVDYWKKFKGTARGIEPSETARRFSPARHFIAKDEKSPLLSKWYSHNRAALVLEHLLNPQSFLANIRNFMFSHHRLMIIVPNEFNPLQKRVDDFWWVNPVHVNYFTSTSLWNFLTKCGYYVTLETSTFPMELFILMGFDYRNNDKLGRKCHLFRLKFEKTFGNKAFDLYKLLYRKFGWGRELVFVAKKRNIGEYS